MPAGKPPPSVTADEVAAIAGFARLELVDGEAEQMAADLAELLEHVAVLDEVDVEGVEPMTHAVDIELTLRPDDVGASLPIDDVLGAAPEEEDGCFVVPSSIARST